MNRQKLKPGDIVEVLHVHEIIKTLDSQGTVDNLPFMPEMIQYCGNKYRIKSRIEKTCVECLKPNNITSGIMMEFMLSDVFYLEDLRCSGSSHDGCQRGCLIFWKEAWLKKSKNIRGKDFIYNDSNEQLRKVLVTRRMNGKYLCQSTQLLKATIPISINKRFLKLIRETLTGEIKTCSAFSSIIRPVLRRLKKLKSNTILNGKSIRTPSDELNLQPGELVEVKSLTEILGTLDKHGRNRGLKFNYGMKEYCGKRFIVRNRLDRMINEATGNMMKIKNTVILKDVSCTYDYKGFGCPRSRFRYWREIWLKRIKED